MKKVLLYFIIFLVITFFMSPDEWFGLWKWNETSWLNFIVKLVVYSVLLFVFEKLLKPLFSKRK